MWPFVLGSIGGVLTFITLELAAFLVTRYIRQVFQEGQKSQNGDVRETLVKIEQPIAHLSEQVAQMMATLEKSVAIDSVDGVSGQRLDVPQRMTAVSQVNTPTTTTDEMPIADNSQCADVPTGQQAATPSHQITVYNSISVGEEQQLREIGHLEGAWTAAGAFKVSRLTLTDEFDRNMVIDIGQKLGLRKDIHDAFARERTNADSFLLDLTCDFWNEPLPVVQPPRAMEQQMFDLLLIPTLDRAPSQNPITISYSGKRAHLKIDLHDSQIQASE